MRTEIQRALIIIVLCLFSGSEIISVQAQSADSVIASVVKNDSIKALSFDVNSIPENTSIYYKNYCDPFGKKLLRGVGLAAGYGILMGGILVALPEDISKWETTEKLKWSSMKQNFIYAYTKPPVIDQDFWYINYIGHPYQGGFYFNNLRSQGADFWTSSAYCLAQSLIWEYVTESIFERPSIQDLISTPIGGVIVGELSHRATLRMRRNGFNTLEKITVCIINPSYAINNGLKTKKEINP